MAVLGIVLVGLGVIVYLLGAIGMLVAAWREGMLWGIGVFLLPVLGLVFTILHWREAKKPFCAQMIGFGVLLLGVFLKAPSAEPTLE